MHTHGLKKLWTNLAGNNKTIFYCILQGVEVSDNSPSLSTDATTRKNEQRTNELPVAVISLGPQQTQQARFEERVNRSENTTKRYSNNLITHTQMFVYKLSTWRLLQLIIIYSYYVWLIERIKFVVRSTPRRSDCWNGNGRAVRRREKKKTNEHK